jgi:hypothetical protein
VKLLLSMLLRPFLVAQAFALRAIAHTNVWSVWVNGIDQGTGNGIRQAAFNGPLKGPGSGSVAHMRSTLTQTSS